MFIAIKSLASATQLNEAYLKILRKCYFQHRAAHQLTLADGVNAQTWTQAQAQAQLQPLREQIERIYRDAQVKVGIAVQPPETGGVAPGASRVRVQMYLKPWDLSANTNPTEFSRWRRKFEQYYLGSDMDVTSIPRQQAALSGCVNSDIEQYLYSVIGDNTPVFTPEPTDVECRNCKKTGHLAIRVV